MFERFKNYLFGEFSADYWSDEAIGLCAALVRNFSADDWLDLKAHVELEGDEQWLQRCADVLGDVVNPSSFESLITLLGKRSEIVFVSAADSIRSLIQQGLLPDDSRARVIQILNDRSAVSSSIERRVIEELSRRLHR